MKMPVYINIAEYMKSKPPNSESKILYLRPFKAYNMLRIF